MCGEYDVLTETDERDTISVNSQFDLVIIIFTALMMTD